MLFRNKPFILALAMLLLAGLACNFTGQEEARSTVPVSTAAVQTLENDLQSAATQIAEDKQVQLVIDESELTSLVAKEIAQQDDPVFTNPQIYLRDGSIQVTGNVNQQGFSVPMEATLTVAADGSGGIDYQVTQANLGPFPLPQNVLDSLTKQLDQALEQNLGPQTSEIFIEDVTIGDGEMIITGQKKS